jgi:RND family efflux transporter MFP subunit
MVSRGLRFAAFAGKLAMAQIMELATMIRKTTVMNLRRWSLLAGIAASTVACGNNRPDAVLAHDPPETTKHLAIPAPPPSESTAVAGGSNILSVLSVEHQVDVSSERDGVVIKIAGEEGNTIKGGETLGQLDDRGLQMELVKARDDLEVSRNNVKFKEAELKAKNAAYHRQQQLRELGLSSQADLEVAEFQAKGAEYDLHGWEALIESGQAEIKRIQIQIEQMRLHAPFSGVIVRRYVREGQAVAKGDKCFRISQLGPLQVQFQIPGSSGGRPQIGQGVRLELVGFSKQPLTARVLKVSPTVDPGSDSYNVLAQLNSPSSPEVRPGMAVRIHWPSTPSTR